MTLYVPNDLDDSLTAVERSVPMPADENAQARVLLERLIEAYRAPDSTHPINVASGVNDVYFLAAPQRKGRADDEEQMAVIDLSGALAAAQPSGIEPETLTLLVDDGDAACESTDGDAGAFSGGRAAAGHAGRTCGPDADVFGI